MEPVDKNNLVGRWGCKVCVWETHDVFVKEREGESTVPKIENEFVAGNNDIVLRLMDI